MADAAAAQPPPQGTDQPAATAPEGSTESAGAAAEGAEAPAAAPAPQSGVKRKRERGEEIEMKEKERKIVMTCGEGGEPCIAGAEGAKNGVGHVGATCLWLVCDSINRCIGRLERLSGINILQAWIDEKETAKAALLASHAAYQKFVVEHVLPADKVETFLKMHCQEGPQRKHGNAGTTNDDRVKCLHAHTATHLSGVPNPVGRVVCRVLTATDTLSDEVDAQKLFAAAIAADEAATGEAPAMTPVEAGKLSAHCEVLLPTFGGNAKSGGRRKKKRLH